MKIQAFEYISRYDGVRFVVCHGYRATNLLFWSTIYRIMQVYLNVYTFIQ